MNYIKKYQKGNKFKRELTDFYTRGTHAIGTLGMSAIGDALYGIKPSLAETVQKYSAGFIPYTNKAMLQANRGNGTNMAISASNAASNALMGIMGGKLLNNIAPVVANKLISKGSNSFLGKTFAPKPSNGEVNSVLDELLNNPYLEETFTPKPKPEPSFTGKRLKSNPQPSDEEVNSILDELLNNPYLEETFNKNLTTKETNNILDRLSSSHPRSNYLRRKRLGNAYNSVYKRAAEEYYNQANKVHNILNDPKFWKRIDTKANIPLGLRNPKFWPN